MATTKVKQIVDRAKLTLQEVTEQGTRWTNEELLDWLNESYQAILQIKPNAHSVNQNMTLAAGTRQEIPAEGLQLIDIVRNTAATSKGEGLMVADRRQLDSTRRGWHREAETEDIEHFMFDQMDPRHFYVYPPAAATAEVEIVFSAVPSAHPSSSVVTGATETIKIADSYAPLMLDYILYRAYSKDADHSANMQRSMGHYQTFARSIGQKTQADFASSPNTEPTSQ